MSLGTFLRQVIAILDRAGVSYMLTGSLAAAYYAQPRATQDVDVVIEPEGERVDVVVNALLDAGFYVSPESAREAQQSRGQFNAIDPESGWKVDLIVRKERAFSRSEFGRRRQASFLGVDVSIASLEDLLLSKLEWSRLGDSALQTRDVAELLDRRWESIDHEYVARWAAELGLQADLQRVVAQIDRQAGGDTDPERSGDD